MKKNFFFTLIGMLLVGTGGVIAWKSLVTSEKEGSLKRRSTTIEVLNESLHLGSFNFSETREGVFEIKNTGDNPLIILDASTSCGCTGVTWPKKPVAPGDTARVQITYTPNARGRFSKSVDLYCNTVPPLTVLRLDGDIE
jgi:hypothetical protein